MWLDGEVEGEMIRRQTLRGGDKEDAKERAQFSIPSLYTEDNEKIRRLLLKLHC